MNGCCSGRVSSKWWSLHLPNYEGVWENRIPTQLLEAGWATTLLVTAAVIWKGLPFDGALFIFAAAGYSLGRLALESMRDHHGTSQKFTVQHAISLLIIALSIAALAGSRLT
jgi:prolipoprotein diacylglyceryltransferase